MIRKSVNSWLIDEDYLRSIPFQGDKYYLPSLCRHIYNFIQNTPVNVYMGWDTNTNDRIYINVGDNSRCNFITTNTSYYDFVTLLRVWLKQFYPKYSCKVSYKRNYTEEEIISLKKECDKLGTKFDLNDALNSVIEDTKIETGVVEKIYLLRDSFVLNVNGVRYMHKTVTISKVMPLKIFMQELRKLTIEKPNSEEIRNFIFNNSVRMEEIEPESRVDIRYSGEMLLNFFRINYQELYDIPLRQDSSNKFHWSWGRFDIYFENNILMKDCIDWYNKRKSDSKREDNDRN